MSSLTTITQSGSFEQAVLAALERCALYLLPHLPFEAEEQLCLALYKVRWALRLPAPRHELLDLRDWPEDAEASAALEQLLNRLHELESQKRTQLRETQRCKSLSEASPNPTKRAS